MKSADRAVTAWLLIVVSCVPALLPADEPDSAQGEEPVLAGPVKPLANANSQLTPIDISAFRSGIHHWRDLRDASRFIQVEKIQPSYAVHQVRAIVDNILLFQRENGGWPKDYDMTAVLSAEQLARVQATRGNNDTSYDNGNIHSQVEYLARAIAQVEEPLWRAACERGLDFVLRSQYGHGGFPQRYPNACGFPAHITFNDGVMIGALNLLQNAAGGAEHFQWLDPTRRQRAQDAFKQGVTCILRCQIQVEGQPTGWCQQHDENTFEPRPARSFELASICPQETTEIVRLLMRQPAASPEIVRAVDAAVAWLQKSRLQGIRVEKVKSTPVSFVRHDTDLDVVVVADAGAQPIWARHYEIGSDRPIFAGRDGIKKYELAQIERERRTGTAWYGGWPQLLIAREYPAWRSQLAE